MKMFKLIIITLMFSALLFSFTALDALAAAKPDLVVKSISGLSASKELGGSISITVTVKNKGKKKAKESVARYYLSIDAIKSDEDILLTGGREAPAIKIRKSNTGTSDVIISDTTPLDAYYVIACADDTKVIQEKNESNNCKASKTTMRVIMGLLRTGQTTSYAAGDDGALQKGVAWPNPRFTDNGDETVMDNLTGLIWAQDAGTPDYKLPLPLGGGYLFNCSGGSKNWQEALDYVNCLNANNYLGHSEWRLPNRTELMSLIDRSKWNPFLPNGHPFLNVQTYNYWSATTNAANTDWAKYVSIMWGNTHHSAKTVSYYVWPVRSGQGVMTVLPKTGQTTCYDATGLVIPCAGSGQDGELQKGVAWPSPRFVTNADTTVTDNLTGLIWEPNGNIMPARDAEWDVDGTANDGRVTWQHALDYVAKLNTENYLGYSDWRLPNVNEFESLINVGEAASDTWLSNLSQGFTNIQGNPYWSSNTLANNAGYSITIMIWSGTVYSENNADSERGWYVWPVRGGQ